MGLLGKETALEEPMSRLLGHLLQQGKISKLADDNVGTNTRQQLLQNRSEVSQILHCTGIGLSLTKTVAAPKATTILEWIWHKDTLTATSYYQGPLNLCRYIQSFKPCNTPLVNKAYATFQRNNL